MEVGGQRHDPAALPPRKNRYPLYRMLGRLQGRFGRVWKISPPTGIPSPDRPARSESLYRLSYPGPYYSIFSRFIKSGVELSVKFMRITESNFIVNAAV